MAPARGSDGTGQSRKQWTTIPSFKSGQVIGRSVKDSSAVETINRVAPWIVFAAGLVLLFPSIWSETSITGQDEYWLSLRTPMETLARGDWITPWVNGEPRIKKPPLLYWAMALSYKLLGINLVAARIWGVLSGAGLAVCSCVIARDLFGRSSLLAGLMTLGTLGVAIQGRMAMIDLPLAFFVSLAIHLSLRWWKSGSWSTILAASVCIAASFLLKGPVGFFFFSVAAITGIIVFKGWGILLSRMHQVLAAVALLLAISLPWPVAMSTMWPSFWNVMGEEFGARHFAAFSFISPFSALGGALGLVFPWTLVLLAALVQTMLVKRQSVDRKRLWLGLCYLCSAVPFFFMHAFERYMVPLIPFICVLCCDWLDEATDSMRIVLIQISMYFTAILALLISLFCLWFGVGIVPAVINLTLIVLILWGATQAGKLKPAHGRVWDHQTTWSIEPRPRADWVPHNPWHAIHVSVASIALLLAVIMGGLYPALGINAMPGNLEEVLGDQPVAVYNTSQPSMLSMRLKRSVLPLGLSDRSGERSLSRFSGFVFLEDSDTPAFEKAASAFGLTIMREGQFKTFYSRRTWLKFVRKGVRADDWKRAIKARSLEDLKSVITYYRVLPKEKGS